MNIFFTEGYDNYFAISSTSATPNMLLSDRYKVPASLSSLALVTGYNGEGYALDFGSSSSISTSHIEIPTARFDDDFCAGFHFYHTGGTGTSSIFKAMTASGHYVTLEVVSSSNGTYTLQYRSSFSGTAVVPTTTFQGPAQKWVYIEFWSRVYPSLPNVRIVTLTINNETIWSASLTYGNSTSLNSFTRYTVGKSPTASSSRYYIDNLYISTGKQYGAMQIKTIVPNADTAQKDGIASTGFQNFAMVDDSAPFSFSDLVTYDGDMQQDAYNVSNLVLDDMNETIIGVQAIAFSRGSSDSNMSISTGLATESTTVKSDPTRSLPSSATVTTSPMVYETNFETGSQWDLNTVSNLRLINEVTVNEEWPPVVSLGIRDGKFTSYAPAIVNSAVYTNPAFVTTANDVMKFQGGYVSFTKYADFRPTPPHSIRFEFCGMKSLYTQVITGLGSLTRPEMLFKITNTGALQVQSGGSGSIYTGTYGTIEDWRWYEVGLMVYCMGTQIRMRGFLDGVEKFDKQIEFALDDVTPFRIGVSSTTGTGVDSNTLFYGNIRNYMMVSDYLWPTRVATDEGRYTNLVFSMYQGLISTDVNMTPLSGYTDPVLNGTEFNFGGTRTLAYVDTNRMRATAPFSAEATFYSNTLSGTQTVFGIGQGASGQPELVLQIVNGQLVLISSTTTTASSRRQYVIMEQFTVSTWLTVGIMIYNGSGGQRIKIISDGVEVVDQLFASPLNSTNGFHVAGNIGSSARLNGGFTALRIGRSEFYDR